MENESTINPPQPSSRLWTWVAGAGIAWGLIVSLFGAICEPTPENLTLGFSIWTAGLYTLGLWFTRKLWLPRLSRHPIRNAILLGIFNAAVIETEFLIFEKLFGAEGVAAHPNLIIDLLMTMPWYIMMVITFVTVQNRWRFPTATVLLLGGIYELGGDGIVGALVGILFGDFQIFTLEYWIMMIFIFLWAFISVYSSMLLPSTWLIAQTDPPARPTSPAWRAALKPMLWLIPFTIYLLGIIFCMLITGGA